MLYIPAGGSFPWVATNNHSPAWCHWDQKGERDPQACLGQLALGRKEQPWPCQTPCGTRQLGAITLSKYMVVYGRKRGRMVHVMWRKDDMKIWRGVGTGGWPAYHLGLSCCQGPCLVPWPTAAMQSVSISLAPVTTEGHANRAAQSWPHISSHLLQVWKLALGSWEQKSWSCPWLAATLRRAGLQLPQQHSRADPVGVSVEELALPFICHVVTWSRERWKPFTPGLSAYAKGGKVVPGFLRARELALPFTACRTQEHRPWVSPGQHNRA